MNLSFLNCQWNCIHTSIVLYIQATTDKTQLTGKVLGEKQFCNFKKVHFAKKMSLKIKKLLEL